MVTWSVRWMISIGYPPEPSMDPGMPVPRQYPPGVSPPGRTRVWYSSIFAFASARSGSSGCAPRAPPPPPPPLLPAFGARYVVQTPVRSGTLAAGACANARSVNMMADNTSVHIVDRLSIRPSCVWSEFVFMNPLGGDCIAFGASIEAYCALIQQ